jgi:2-dehydro-3-deoxyphosphogluconate aldolase/(4S)-4-hydroxy-2-oxoglutarate aldolase
MAGARFVVSPSLNLETIACCRRHGVAVIPGALTPTEILTAATAGAAYIKAGASALGVGSDLVDRQALRDDQAQVITDRARQFVKLVADARALAEA